MQIPTLENINKEIWNLIESGVNDITSSFHFPSLSTISLDGNPTSRTVVLRSVNYEKKTMSFNTDIRSSKWQEMNKNANISMHIYDFNKKTQIRIVGQAMLNYNNKAWEDAWNSSTIMGKECYSTPCNPSTIIDNPEIIDKNIKDIKFKSDELDQFKVNFGRIDIKIMSIDWLYLLHTGHRRAKFTYNENIEMVWLAP